MNKNLFITLGLLAAAVVGYFLFKKKGVTTKDVTDAATTAANAAKNVLVDTLDVEEATSQYNATANMTDEEKAAIEQKKAEALEAANVKAQLRIDYKSLFNAVAPLSYTTEQLQSEIAAKKALNVLLQKYIEQTGDKDTSDNNFKTAAEVENAIAAYENKKKEELEAAYSFYKTVTGLTDASKYRTRADVYAAIDTWKVQQSNNAKIKAWNERKKYLDGKVTWCYKDLKKAASNKGKSGQQEISNFSDRDLVYFVDMYDNVLRLRDGKRDTLIKQLADDDHMSKTGAYVTKTLNRVRAIKNLGWSIKDIDQYGNSTKFA